MREDRFTGGDFLDHSLQAFQLSMLLKLISLRNRVGVVTAERSEDFDIVDTARLGVCGDVVDDILTVGLNILPRMSTV